MEGKRYSEVQDRKIFVGGLHHDTTESKLRAFYEKFGEVEDCVVLIDPHTQRSRGFGFVTYKTLFAVDEALGKRPHIIDGKEVEPKMSTPRDESKADSRVSEAVRKVFVGGISQDTNEEHLRDYFKRYGQIENVLLMMDRKTGKNRGFAFIVFQFPEQADQCCSKRVHDVNGRQCEVKRALPRDDKRMSDRPPSPVRRSSRERDYLPPPPSVGLSRYAAAAAYDARGYPLVPYGRSGSPGRESYHAYASYAAYLSAMGYPGYRLSEGYLPGGYGDSRLEAAYRAAYGAGPIKSSSYMSRSVGPYGGGYGIDRAYAESSRYALSSAGYLDASRPISPRARSPPSYRGRSGSPPPAALYASSRGSPSAVVYGSASSSRHARRSRSPPVSAVYSSSRRRSRSPPLPAAYGSSSSLRASHRVPSPTGVSYSSTRPTRSGSPTTAAVYAGSREVRASSPGYIYARRSPSPDDRYSASAGVHRAASPTAGHGSRAVRASSPGAKYGGSAAATRATSSAYSPGANPYQRSPSPYGSRSIPTEYSVYGGY